ncbi:MAG: M1 family aminopeptidase [Candidatus Eisenbacteria bacterium]
MGRALLAFAFLLAVNAAFAEEAPLRPADRIVAGPETGSAGRLPARLAELRGGGGSFTLPTECPDSLDMIHYELHISVDHGGGTLEGDAFLTFRSLKEGLGGIRLDFRALTVSAVTRDGAPLAFTHAGDTLLVTLDSPLPLGDTAVVEIAYGGVPDNVGGGGFGGFWIYPFPITDFSMGIGLYTDPPSMGRYWFPSVDQPCDKVTCDIIATTSLVKTAVANGYLDTVIVDSVQGTKEWHWREEHPITTYLMALSIAKYTAVPDSFDTRIVYYVHNTMSHLTAGTFANVHLMMDAFENLFGPYPYPGDKFSFVTTPLGDMEHQTCVFHARTLMTGDSTYDDILSHELSHMWFGDCVTYGDFRDVWLSEGFASYCEALWREAGYGDEAYHDYVTMSLMRPYLLNAANLDYPIYDPDELWGTVSYEKGGVALHMLRRVMGDGLFFAAMNTYLDDFAYGTAFTTDFRDVCEAVYGGDLDWFFDEWIYAGGHPVFDWGWTAEETGPGSWRVDVETRQVQTVGPIYTMPVDFRIETAGGDTTVTAWVDGPAGSFSFTVGAAPSAVVFDPDDWLLDESSEIATGTPSGAPLARLVLGANRPNPFNPSTTIPFALPAEGPVALRIYGVNGALVRTLFAGALPAGEHRLVWDGADDRDRPAPSGVYFVRLGGAGGTETRKIQLLR